jgi:hypothetical protein
MHYLGENSLSDYASDNEASTYEPEGEAHGDGWTYDVQWIECSDPEGCGSPIEEHWQPYDIHTDEDEYSEDNYVSKYAYASEYNTQEDEEGQASSYESDCQDYPDDWSNE